MSIGFNRLMDGLHVLFLLHKPARYLDEARIFQHLSINFSYFSGSLYCSRAPVVFTITLILVAWDQAAPKHLVKLVLPTY